MALTTLPRKPDPEGDADALARVVAAEGVDELVVGLPLHASGAVGSQANSTQTWVEQVAPLLGLPVTFRDERLTSHLAELRVGPMSGAGPAGRRRGPSAMRIAPDRPRGRRDHPPGRARRTGSSGGRRRGRNRRSGDRARAGPSAHGRRHGDPHMTIRSGGRPRDAAGTSDRAVTPDEPWEPDYRPDRGAYGYDNGYGNGRNSRRRGSGRGGMGKDRQVPRLCARSGGDRARRVRHLSPPARHRRRRPAGRPTTPAPSASTSSPTWSRRTSATS